MKSYLSLITLVLISIYSIGQTTYTPTYTWSTFGIKTPKGANIESGRLENVYYLGNTYSDYPNEVKTAYREDFENNPANSNKKVEGDITFTYNCHSYAWNKAEGGTINHWITAYYNSQSSGNDNLSQYWGTNGGYTQVSSRNDANKIYYSDGDHSALLTSTSSDTVISKWGAMLLVKHHYLDCPYDLTNLQYYKLSNPTISSNSYAPLCNNVPRTYSSDIVETNFTYNWSINSYLDTVTGNGTSSYTVKGISQNGQGIVSLTVTTPSGATATKNKTVWVGKPSFDEIYLGVILTDPPHDEACINQIISLGVTNSNAAAQGVIGYHWLFGSWDPYFMGYEIMGGTYFNTIANFMLDDYAPEMQIVGVSAQNTCDYGNPQYKDFYAVDCGGGYYMVFSPNPVVGETTLSIESSSTEKNFDDNTEWELEVYNQSQILKEKKTKLRGKSTTIQTNGWKEGVYMVRVKYSRDGKSDEVLLGKLVVKK